MQDKSPSRRIRNQNRYNPSKLAVRKSARKRTVRVSGASAVHEFTFILKSSERVYERYFLLISLSASLSLRDKRLSFFFLIY